MNPSCENVRSLLSSYLDGELSEEQAAPMRSHLFDCPACRESVQEGKVIQRWFEPGREAPVEVPSGFAARVARRAFAGDPGLEAPGSATGDPVTTSAGAPSGRGTLLPFVVKLSAVAAGLLFTFSLLIQRISLPTTNEMEAQSAPFWETLELEGEALDPEAEAPEEEEESPDSTGEADQR